MYVQVAPGVSNLLLVARGPYFVHKPLQGGKVVYGHLGCTDYAKILNIM